MKYLVTYNNGETWYFMSDVILDPQTLSYLKEDQWEVTIFRCSKRNRRQVMKSEPVLISIDKLDNIRPEYQEMLIA